MKKMKWAQLNGIEKKLQPMLMWIIKWITMRFTILCSTMRKSLPWLSNQEVFERSIKKNQTGIYICFPNSKNPHGRFFVIEHL